MQVFWWTQKEIGKPQHQCDFRGENEHKKNTHAVKVKNAKLACGRPCRLEKYYSIIKLNANTALEWSKNSRCALQYCIKTMIVLIFSFFYMNLRPQCQKKILLGKNKNLNPLFKMC